jgi:hypothetical protein
MKKIIFSLFLLFFSTRLLAKDYSISNYQYIILTFPEINKTVYIVTDKKESSININSAISKDSNKFTIIHNSFIALNSYHLIYKNHIIYNDDYNFFQGSECSTVVLNSKGIWLCSYIDNGIFKTDKNITY